jgi:hypothetical protein
MPISGTNNWGPYTTADSTGAQYPSYPAPEGTATPPPTGNLAPAQSPSGSVTNQSATWNFTNGETSTEEYVSVLVAKTQQGSASVNAANPFAGVLPQYGVQQFRWQ